MWNRIVKRYFFFIQILSFSLASYGQTDSTLFTYQEYLNNILLYHPIAKQAALQTKLANAEMLDAKGNLDPKLYADWDQKNFDDKLYFRRYQAKLKVPTILGIDISGGYENTQGNYLNPENKTDDFGLWHLGIEANVLQGLIINERKTAFDQAEVFQQLAKNEQQIILNDLVYYASTVYLIWQQYESFKEVLNENVTIANRYYENTKQSFFEGEKTAMDTLEAFILYQDATAIIQKNEMGLIKSRQNIENFLWYENVPLELQENTKPENYESEIFPEYQLFENEVLSSHPVILNTINKLNILEIEQKLKREKLKPKLKVKYNPLLGTSADNVAPNLALNDFKWGFGFSMPLLMRSERAGIQRGEVKMEETMLDIQNKRNELQNKIENSWLQQLLLQQQEQLIANNLGNYKRLLDGENEKFKFGESSVFLLNKRQEKYINGQLKLVETKVKRQIELLNFLYLSNQLID